MPGSSLVVELIGPPGAGKSTLARMLGARDRRVRTPLSIWGLPRGRLVMRACRSLPRMVVRQRALREGTLGLTAHRIRLDVLHETLEALRGTPQIIPLDEGPIFTLIWMRMFHPAVVDSSASRVWWRQEIERWGRSVDAVIELDAADAVLTGRIRGRSKPHPIKDSTDEEIHAFIDSFRSALGQVRRDLEASSGARVLRVSADDASLNEAVDNVLQSLREGCHVG